MTRSPNRFLRFPSHKHFPRLRKRDFRNIYNTDLLSNIYFINFSCYFGQRKQFFPPGAFTFPTSSFHVPLKTRAILFQFSIITQVIIEILVISLVEDYVISCYNHLTRGGSTNFQTAAWRFVDVSEEEISIKDQGHPTEYFGKISVRMEGALKISKVFAKRFPGLLEVFRKTTKLP